MKITVPVKDQTGVLVLREFIGDGQCEGYDFELTVSLTTKNPIVEVDGRTYTVAIEDIVRAIVHQHIKLKRE